MKFVQTSHALSAADYPTGTNMDMATIFATTVALTIAQDNTKSDIVEIWVRGSSGAILGALLFQALTTLKPQYRIKVHHIRKDGESTHSGNGGIAWRSQGPSAYNIIIDDFISSGTTLKQIFKVIDASGIQIVDCVAIGEADYWPIDLPVETKMLISNMELPIAVREKMIPIKEEVAF